jgi:predicted nucleic acid-binding protein
VDNLAVDASVLSAFFLDEENGGKLQRLIESNARFYAPSLWRFEVSNAVWKRKAIPGDVAKGIIEKTWSFTVYGEDSTGWVEEAFFLSRKNNITFYDSSYIAIAKFFGIHLWTLDKVQAKAAVGAGVPLWEE